LAVLANVLLLGGLGWRLGAKTVVIARVFDAKGRRYLVGWAGAKSTRGGYGIPNYLDYLF